MSYEPQYAEVRLSGGQSLGFQGDQGEAPPDPLVAPETDDLEYERAALAEAGV